MKMTVKEFFDSFLPGLRTKNKELAALKKSIEDFFKLHEVVGEDGKPVGVDQIELVPAPVPEKETKSADPPETKADEPANLKARVETLVAEALKSAPATTFRLREPEHKKAVIPATCRRIGSLENAKHFKGLDQRTREEWCYKFAQWAYATASVASAVQFCKDHGVTLTKAASEGINTAGGFLVPPEFATGIIDLVETFGVFRRNANIEPMGSDTKSVPRRTGGLTANFIGENTAITESQMTWDNVNLVAKKLAVMSRYSSEIAEDAIINFGDKLAGEIARAFALKEDQCGFTGTGTATFGGINGLLNLLAWGNRPAGATPTYFGILNAPSSGGAGWANLTLADFNFITAAVPQFTAQSGNCKWYCSQAFWGQVMQRLAMAVGGATITEVIDGIQRPYFCGYPVEVSQVCPTATAANTTCCLFGDLKQAATLGDRRAMTVTLSDQRYWDQDQLAIKGTERFDIVVHDLGTLTVAGPMVALATV